MNRRFRGRKPCGIAVYRKKEGAVSWAVPSLFYAGSLVQLVRVQENFLRVPVRLLERLNQVLRLAEQVQLGPAGVGRGGRIFPQDFLPLRTDGFHSVPQKAEGSLVAGFHKFLSYFPASFMCGSQTAPSG